MSVDSERTQHEEDPLEDTELARRLRRMEWPPAPADVKQRVLQRIVAQSGDGVDGADGNGDGARHDGAGD